MALELVMLRWFDLSHPISLFLLFIFSVLFLFKLNRAGSEKPNLPPSPPKLPIIGNLHQLGKLAHCSLRDLSDKYGPLMLMHLGGPPTLIVSSAEMAREVMKNNDIAFANRPHTTAGRMLLYECVDVGFAPYGEYWREIRKISVTELLSIKRVQSFKSIREEEVAIMIDQISHSCKLGASINLSKMIMALSNNIVSRCSLGRKHAGEDGKNKFGEVAREFMKLFVAFSFGDLFPWMGWIDILTGLIKNMKKVSRELDTLFDEIIDEHLAQSKHDDPYDKKDFVGLLLHVQQSNVLNIKLTRTNIKAIILDMFVGGTDTTSTTIEWAMAELIKNPNLMQKAQEEVRRVVGKKSKVDEEDINKMDYLKSVVKETLRLHPPATLLVPRESSTATNLKGFHVPAKTRVFVNAWAIQRDPESWYRPDEFIPERFMNNPTDFKGQDYEFIPFGSGRRGCPGISFGVAAVEFAIVNLIYWYDWKLAGGVNEKDLDMTEEFGLTVNKKIPLHLVPIFHFS